MDRWKMAREDGENVNERGKDGEGWRFGTYRSSLVSARTSELEVTKNI